MGVEPCVWLPAARLVQGTGLLRLGPGTAWAGVVEAAGMARLEAVRKGTFWLPGACWGVSRGSLAGKEVRGASLYTVRLGCWHFWQMFLLSPAVMQHTQIRGASRQILLMLAAPYQLTADGFWKPGFFPGTGGAA